MLNDVIRCKSLSKHGRDCDQVPPDGTFKSLSISSLRTRGSRSISPHHTFNTSRIPYHKDPL